MANGHGLGAVDKKARRQSNWFEQLTKTEIVSFYI